jgi:large subunit ribosomal protein L18
MNVLKQVRMERRKAGIRKRVIGTQERPRMSVFRSASHIYVQVIDDHTRRTLLGVDSRQAKLANGGNVTAAKEVGRLVAQKAKEAGITRVVFDRNGYRYHGRVKALADAAREAGLSF